MKYHKGQQVILLDVNGLPAYSAEIRRYEESDKQYRVAYKTANDETEWIEDVPEDRLRLLTDAVSIFKKN